MPWHDKVVGLPNDTARFAFVKVLCAAKIRGRSTFTAASLREQLGSHARAIPALVTAGLLDENGDMLSVHGFDEYQRKAGHAEAQQRYRQKSTDGSPDDHAPITKRSPTEQDSTGRDMTPPYPPSGSTSAFARSSHDGRHGRDCMVCFPPSEQRVRVVK